MLSRRTSLQRQLGLIVLAGFGLGASFIDENFFFIPWICFVPFLLALDGVSIKRGFFLGLLFGSIVFVIASHWIVGFLEQISGASHLYTILLACIYWFYCAQQFALLAAVVVWFSRIQAGSEWLSLSLFSTLFFYGIPLIFPADLSVTQGKFLLALQPVDVTGALGLHFIILLHNGLLYALIRNSFASLKRAQYVAVGLICTWFIYGICAYYYWTNQEPRWPKLDIGVVQPDVEPSIDIPKPYSGYSRAYPPEIDLSISLAKAGADLIVWPEARYRGFFNEAYVQDAFTHYARETGASLLIQDLKTSGSLTFNESALIDKNGWQEYSKQVRIPFGEYMPGESLPVLGSFIKKLFGDFYTPIATGSYTEPFKFKDIKFQPLVCFEVAHPYYVTGLMQLATERKTPVQLLIAQSNNSWFDTSIEPRLHLATSQLRSIEQRLPLIHALNNGPSSFYKANGQASAVLMANERTTGLASLAYPEHVPLTLFARFPYLFINLVFTFLVIWVSRSLLLSKKNKSVL